MKRKEQPGLISLAMFWAMLMCAANAAAATASIGGLRMIDAHVGWAWTPGLHDDGRLLRTSDGGQTWRDVTPTVSPYRFDKASFLDAQNAWVTTIDSNYRAGLLRTTNGGASWSVLSEPRAAAFGIVGEGGEVQFVNPHDGVMKAADFGAGNAYYRFFDTHDSGANWQIVNMIVGWADSNEDLGTVHLCNLCGDNIGFYPPGKVFMTLGDMGDETPKGFARLSLSTNSGKSWRDLKLPLPKKCRQDLVVPYLPVFFGADRWNCKLRSTSTILTSSHQTKFWWPTAPICSLPITAREAGRP